MATPEPLRRGGRQRDNPTWKYVLEVEEAGKKKIKCMVNNCNVLATTIANMERHMSRTHPDVFLLIGMQKVEQSRMKELAEQDAAFAKKRKKEDASVLNGVKLSMQQIKDAMVKLVTVNARPFTVVEDEGLQDILQPLIDALPDSERVSITAESVRSDVTTRAEETRKKIREEVSGKLVSLKVDCVTGLDRSFLGVHIQYARHGKLQLRTLAVKELFVRHTAEDLKRVIQDILWDYNISVDQIYSFTCDSGANMVFEASLLQDEQDLDLGSVAENDGDVDIADVESAPARNGDGSGGSGPGSDSDAEDEPDEDLDEDLAEDAGGRALDEPCLDDHNSLKMLELCSCEFSADDGSLIVCVRCAAHQLHLAVSDTLEAEERASSCIKQMRDLCRKLQTKDVALLLSNLKLKKPILDVDSSWNSTVDMLSSVLALQSFCKQFKTSDINKLYVCSAVWKQAKRIVESLEPARVATKVLQNELLVMGDFYGAWLKCKLETQIVQTRCANTLVKNMEKREALLMENDAFLGAIYMDPRYFSMLSSASALKAETHLQKVWARIERFCINPQRIQVAASTARTSQPAPEAGLKKLSRFEKFLAEKDAERLSRSGALAEFNVVPRLATFRASPREMPWTNVLEYWELRKVAMPQLYELAVVVLNVPATQVSVERVFSAIKFIQADRRFNLNSDALNDLIVLRYDSLSTCSSKRPRSPLSRVRHNTSPAACDSYVADTSAGDGSVSPSLSVVSSASALLALTGRRRCDSSASGSGSSRTSSYSSRDMEMLMEVERS